MVAIKLSQNKCCCDILLFSLSLANISRVTVTVTGSGSRLSHKTIATVCCAQNRKDAVAVVSVSGPELNFDQISVIHLKTGRAEDRMMRYYIFLMYRNRNKNRNKKEVFSQFLSSSKLKFHLRVVVGKDIPFPTFLFCNCYYYSSSVDDTLINVNSMIYCDTPISGGKSQPGTILMR